MSSVSERRRCPWVAVWVSAGAAFLLALWAEAYTAMVALSTLALYASYALPIAAGLRARRTGVWRERGPWDLGRLSFVTNAFSLAWIAACVVLFVLPPNELAGFTFAGTLASLALYWSLWARRNFQGPPGLSR